MIQEHREEHVLGIHTSSRAFALLWASPFLLFTAFPLYGAYLYGLNRPLGMGLLLTVLGFSAAYLYSWLSNPVSPRPGPVPTVFWVSHVSLLVLQILLTWLIHLMGASGGMHMLSFSVAAWTLQAPRRLIPHGLIVFLLLTLGEYLAFDSGLFIPLPLIGAGIPTLLSRFTIEASIRKDARSEQLLLMARERERDRISADLHDILGHTLTGMTIKADLVKRLIEKGRSEEAHTQVSELLTLSRSALTEIRAVVQANHQLDLDEEIRSAAALLSASGVDLQVRREGTPPVGVASSLVARVIREGTTNIVVHSTASRALLTIRHDGAELRNNGFSESYSRKTRGSGSGLRSLAERAAEYGTFTWASEGSWWVVTLQLDHMAYPLPDEVVSSADVEVP